MRIQNIVNKQTKIIVIILKIKDCTGKFEAPMALTNYRG